MGLITKFWRTKWRPDAYYPDLSRLPLEDYHARGYRLILLDIDNTLTVHGEREKSEFASRQLERVRQSGLTPVILSNAKSERAAAMGRSLGVPAIGMAMKPGVRGIEKAVEENGVTKDEILLCGDQIFTDVWAGRKAGIGSILVRPHRTKGEPPQIRVKRIMENWLLKRFQCVPTYDDILDGEGKK